ncbi:MAG TPA: hypothetical protein VMF06_16520 [Candidatus Limnocylindria bacterium]|jgi:hypothetical protein|nr:hypothetical protein [Candidatus Limnocylindria bacterium]
MKLVFSEAQPDYGNYLYPYVVWAFPEPGETPADFFEAGFLPGTPSLERFYLTRQLRVPLDGWRPNSENRRILRKGEGWTCQLIPRAEFDFNEARRTAWLAYANERFGDGIMPGTRLDRLMSGAMISHLLHFTSNADGKDLGTALLHIEASRVAFYAYAFYDLACQDRNLGMFMMTRAVQLFSESGFSHIYLGTCYSERALYKSQFEPVEFSNGFGWSRDMEALRHLIRSAPPQKHRLETDEYLSFYPEGLAGIVAASPFHIAVPRVSGKTNSRGGAEARSGKVS